MKINVSHGGKQLQFKNGNLLYGFSDLVSIIIIFFNDSTIVPSYCFKNILCGGVSIEVWRSIVIS